MLHLRSGIIAFRDPQHEGIVGGNSEYVSDNEFFLQYIF